MLVHDIKYLRIVISLLEVLQLQMSECLLILEPELGELLVDIVGPAFLLHDAELIGRQLLVVLVHIDEIINDILEHVGHTEKVEEEQNCGVLSSHEPAFDANVVVLNDVCTCHKAVTLSVKVPDYLVARQNEEVGDGKHCRNHVQDQTNLDTMHKQDGHGVVRYRLLLVVLQQ